jgi:hypothetical protein
MSDISRPPIKRVNYFAGETLQTDDFICEQQYHMELRTLLNSSLHTWGIANGLTVRLEGGSQSNQLKVDPGMAIDQLGRQIVLTASQIVQFHGVKGGQTVYLTIRYQEVYADYTEESGVSGYKRIVQQPKLEYLPTLEEPGIHILLAVVCFSAEGSIDDLTFKRGKFERRHVGSRIGRIQLVTEAAENESTGGVLLQALRGPNDAGDYMDVQASRSQFSGMLATRGNLGVGVEYPQANLELTSILSHGPGTFKTQGATMTLTPGIYPPLQPGDAVIPEQLHGTATSSPSRAVIAGMTTPAPEGAQTYTIKRAFDDDVVRPASYSYIRKHLVRFSAGADPEKPEEVLLIDNEGNVGLGRRAAVNSGSAGPAALRITAARKVAIFFDNPAVDPQEALEVNGTVKALAMNVAGVSVQTDGSVILLGGREPISIGTDNVICAGTATTDGFIVASFGPQQVDQQVPNFFGMLSCTLPDGVVYKASASFEHHQDDNGSFQNPVFGTLSVPVRKGEQWTLELDIKWSHYCTLFIQAQWVPFGPSCTAAAPPADTRHVPPI